MAGTTTTLTAALKVFYVTNEIKELLNNQSVLFDKLGRNASDMLDVTGKNYTYAIRTTRNRYAGRGYAEGGALASYVGEQGVENIIIPRKRLVAPIEISGDLAKSATGPNKGAFASAFTLEVEGALQDFARSINRQLHSDGTDALAFWTGADDSSGTNVDDGQGNAFVHLESGATTLDLIDASDNSTVLGDDIVVTRGADAATNVAVTWTGTVSGSADGDYLVLPGSLGTQLMGIRGVVDDANPPLLSGGLHGLAVATYPYWKARMFGNSGTNRDLTLELMQKPITSIVLNSGIAERDIDFLMCNGQVRDKYVQLLLADQRQPATGVLKGGFTSVDFNGKPIIVDGQCRRNTLYYIASKTMDILTSSGGIDWAIFDGEEMWKMKTGSSGYSDAYQAFARFYGDLACSQRNGNGALEDISD